MNDRMNFDIDIMLKEGHQDLEFIFSIEHAISTNSLDMIRVSKNNVDEEKYRTVSYLYGRLIIGQDSFFAEVVGYIDNAQPAIVTYHIVAVDPLFFDKYEFDKSNSDFDDSDMIAFT